MGLLGSSPSWTPAVGRRWR